jgi:hypothetical protein
MHLPPEELVDLAEGTRPEASAPHLASCAECRRQLGEMRAMMSAAAGVDVPEPSPLFWDHLSARVSDAVAVERAPRAGWLHVAAWRRFPVSASAAAVAAIIVVVALSLRSMAPEPRVAPQLPSDGSSAAANAPVATVVSANDSLSATLNGAPYTDDLADDASLMLMASLTSAIDLEAARDAGLAPSGSAEDAVTYMDAAQLRELQRLLKEEMGS